MKYALTLLVFGLCFDFIGALLKILHHPFANSLLIMGTVLKVLAALLFLYKVLKHPKFKDFFDNKKM